MSYKTAKDQKQRAAYDKAMAAQRAPAQACPRASGSEANCDRCGSKGSWYDRSYTPPRLVGAEPCKGA